MTKKSPQLPKKFTVGKLPKFRGPEQERKYFEKVKREQEKKKEGKK